MDYYNNTICASAALTCTGGYPIWTEDNSTTKTNKKNMKEGNLKRYELVFIETVKTKHKFDVLAESLEDAKEKIADGVFREKKEVITSIDRVLESSNEIN